jgi:membrane protein YqaA with SNARE-associated domain
MIDIIETLKEFGIGLVSSYGYFGLFFIAFVGTSIIPIPVEIITFFAVGFLKNPLAVGLVAGTGSALGSSINYFIGLGIRKGIYERFGREKVKWAKRFFEKHGFFAIAIAAFVPTLSDLFMLVSGFMKYDLKKHIAANFLGRIPRFLIVSFLAAEAFKIFGV